MLNGILAFIGAIVFAVYRQLIFKARVLEITKYLAEEGVSGHIALIFAAVRDPLVISGYIGGLIGSLCWLITLKYFPLYIAYSATSISIVMVVILERYIWKVRISPIQLIGIVLVIIGVYLIGIGREVPS